MALRLGKYQCMLTTGIFESERELNDPAIKFLVSKRGARFI